jgi:uncharacterized protein
MYNENNFFEELERNGITINNEQRKQITDRVSQVLNYEPKVGIFGKTGVGKSSLCNALFGKEICPISDVEACTRDTKEVFLGMGNSKGLKLVDVPGVGESRDRDEEYAKLYSKLLPELDLVLWLIKSDDRALASDESFYKNIVRPHIQEGKPFFFVLNQVDKIEPFREWDIEKHEPGPKQFQNIHRKINDVATFFDIAASKVVPVSANEKYNLTKLVDEIVYSLPKDRKITFFKEVTKEFQSEVAGEHVKKSFVEVAGEAVVKALEVTGQVVTTTVETVGRVIEKGLDYVANKIDNFIDRLPIIGKKSGGCYITTAVCNYYGKPDDCYELGQFRKFRDEWLTFQEDGQKLIDEYYSKAPEVVNKIEDREDKDVIYADINSNYLVPCLNLIEQHQYEACKNLYVEMVSKLNSRVM